MSERQYMKVARKKAGLTQKRLAERMNMTESNYSLIESGKRKIKMDISFILKLASVINESPHTLISSEVDHQKLLQVDKHNTHIHKRGD